MENQRSRVAFGSVRVAALPHTVHSLFRYSRNGTAGTYSEQKKASKVEAFGHSGHRVVLVLWSGLYGLIEKFKFRHDELRDIRSVPGNIL